MSRSYKNLKTSVIHADDFLISHHGYRELQQQDLKIERRGLSYKTHPHTGSIKEPRHDDWIILVPTKKSNKSKRTKKRTKDLTPLVQLVREFHINKQIEEEERQLNDLEDHGEYEFYLFQ